MADQTQHIKTLSESPTSNSFELIDRENTELNSQRKIIRLRKSEVSVENSVCNVIEKLVEHGIHCLTCSYTNDVIDLSS